MNIDELSSWQLDSIADGSTILFLGAGASFAARNASGAKALDGRALADAINEHYLAGRKPGARLDKVSERAKHHAGIVDVEQFVKNRFDGLQPTSGHRILTSFRWKAMVTTNFDCLIEDAYESNNDRLQDPNVILEDHDLSGHVPKPREVPLIKLHGCVRNLKNPGPNLILAEEEYAHYESMKGRLFSAFQTWAQTSPVLFVGYSLDDFSIKSMLYEIGSEPNDRPKYITVMKDIDEDDEDYWRSKRVTPIEDTFINFFETLDKKINPQVRSLSAAKGASEISISPWISSHDSPSNGLFQLLEHGLDHIHPGVESSYVAPVDFYESRKFDWQVFENDYDVRRHITDDLIEEVQREADSRNETKVVLVRGYAGSGKTVTVRRALWDAAHEARALVFESQPSGYFDNNCISEIARLTQERFSIYFPDSLSRAEEVTEFIGYAKSRDLRITVFLEARTNEWNEYDGSLQELVDSEYELRDLRGRESDDLIARLRKFECLGDLVSTTDQYLKKFLNLTSNRQLLVALHEILNNGDEFDNIIADEVRRITPASARELYVDLATIHQFGASVRAGLVTRLCGASFGDLREKFFSPLEDVVHVEFSRRDLDYQYRTRHSVVAEIVFQQVFSSDKVKSQQLARIIRQMNVAFGSDEQVFQKVARGKYLARQFPDRQDAERVLKAITAAQPDGWFVWHQRAVFELNHRDGSLSTAEEAIGRAKELAGDRVPRSVVNTQARIKIRQAAEMAAAPVRNRLLMEARGLVGDAPDRTPDAYAHAALAESYLVELEALLKTAQFDAVAKRSSSNEQVPIETEDQVRDLARLLAEVDQVITAGEARFPDNSFIRDLSARLTGMLEGQDEALEVLRRAVKDLPDSAFLVSRLARWERSRGNLDRAITLLESYLERDPLDDVINFALARALIESNEDKHAGRIEKALRRSFKEKDQNVEAHFWLARHEALHGDPEVAKRLFGILREKRIGSAERKRWKAAGRENGNGVRAIGRVKGKKQSFAFCKVDGVGMDVYIHSSDVEGVDWEKVAVGDFVALDIGFSFNGPIGKRVQSQME